MAKSMKFIITSDIHVHKYKNFNQNNRRLMNLIRLIEDLWETANNNGANILIAGDLFNNMQTMHTEVAVAVSAVFQNMAETYPHIKCLIISGNHDYATKNFFERPAVSAVMVLDGLADNVFVIDNSSMPMSGINVYGLPYYEYKEDLDKALDELAAMADDNKSNRGHTNILLMHQTIGFGHELVPDDIDPEDPRFGAFDVVFNGHIHKASTINDRFYNIGSPIHRDLGDEGQEKGFRLLDIDSEKFEVEFIPLTEYPVYRQVTEGEEIPKEWKNDYVVVVPKPITVDPAEEEIRENFAPGKTKEELLVGYIDVNLGDTDPEFGKKVMAYLPKVLSYEN